MTEPIVVLAQVIMNEMGLSQKQILLAYQKFVIERTQGLYVALDYVSSQMVGGNNYQLPTDIGMTQSGQVTMRHLIQIDILSFNSEARQRKEEILMALSSVSAQQAMNANSMQIARVPSGFVNTASLEETKILNRFSITVAVTALHVKQSATDQFYDKFTAEFLPDVDTEPIEADPKQPMAGGIT